MARLQFATSSMCAGTKCLRKFTPRKHKLTHYVCRCLVQIHAKSRNATYIFFQFFHLLEKNVLNVGRSDCNYFAGSWSNWNGPSTFFSLPVPINNNGFTLWLHGCGLPITFTLVRHCNITYVPTCPSCTYNATSSGCFIPRFFGNFRLKILQRPMGEQWLHETSSGTL